MVLSNGPNSWNYKNATSPRWTHGCRCIGCKGMCRNVRQRFHASCGSRPTSVCYKDARLNEPTKSGLPSHTRECDDRILLFGNGNPDNHFYIAVR